MDLDGDGHQDILSGSYSRMDQDMAGLFQVLWGQPDGSFKKAAVLKGTDGEPLIIPISGREQMTLNICTRPFAVDWDADGDLDLVVGNFAGSFYVFSGEGQGEFNPKPEPITASGEPLKINGAHSDPFVIDWDQDGDLDLLSGSSNGGVQWAENLAGPEKTPAFKSFQDLIKPGAGVAYGSPLSADEVTGPTTSTRIWVDDVDKDGKLDILVGDSLTLITVKNGLDESEFQRKREQWQAALSEASQKMVDAADNPEKQQEARDEYFQVYQQRSEFMKEDRTGFVWLYRQK